MNTESDDAFLQELISRLPKVAMMKTVRLSKGSIPVTGEEESRLLDIASRRGKIAAAMLEEMLK